MNIPTALFLQTCDTILQSNKTVQCIFKRRQEFRKKKSRVTKSEVNEMTQSKHTPLLWMLNPQIKDN